MTDNEMKSFLEELNLFLTRISMRVLRLTQKESTQLQLKIIKLS